MATARVPNPYRPGFNQSPVALAGRDAVLDGVEESLQVAALDGRTPRPVVLTGGRGVGKTVLLGAVAELAASRHGWLTVPIEVRAGTPSGRSSSNDCRPPPTSTARRRRTSESG